jgi:hypothetical protein
MRDAKDVKVERAIVHLINHLKQDITDSEAELPLDANVKLRNYFSDQVNNALSDGQTSSARFSTEGDQSAVAETQKILGNGKDFIPSSLELARLLMKAMGKDARIKPATASLAVCLYTATNYPGINFLALIKIDPTEALVERVTTTEKGKQIVTFDILPDVMPTKEVKLRKAALVPPKGKMDNLDLLLLDRQVTDVAANFFRIAFLNTLSVLNPEESAKSFLSLTEKTRRAFFEAAEGKPERIGPKESDLFMRHIEKSVLSGGFNRAKFASKAPLPEAARKMLAKRLEKQFPEDTQIKFDKKFAKEIFLRKTRYRGDRGVLLEVDSQYFNEVVTKMKDDKPLADGTIITRLELAVPNLHRIT